MSRTTGYMEEITIKGYPDPVWRRSGFPGERISVLPRPRVAEALQHPVTSRLVVTDCGFFPHAADHLRERPSGCPETIVIVCVDGFGWCRLSNCTFAVKPGQALVVPARAAHTYGASAEDPWTVWWMHLRGQDVEPLLAASGARPSSPVITAADVTRAAGLIDEALRTMERDDSPPRLQAAAGAAWHLLALLSAAPLGIGPLRSDPVQVAIEQIQEHFAEKICVADLASASGLSASHFSALFKRAVGCGPHEYQTRLRMMRSRQLLDTTDIAVSAIARAVGYRDALYFSRQFKAVHGVTATEHRARAKG